MKKSGELFIFISILAFSISDLFDRVAVIETDPFLATLIKCIIICVFVFLFSLKEGFNLKGSAYFIASGFISEIVGSVSFMQSLRYGISVALPVIQSQVIFTALLSFLLLNERLSKKAYGGVIVIFAGLATLAYSQAYNSAVSNPIIGFGFALIAAAGWGSGAVLWKMGLEHGASSDTGLIIHYLTAIAALSFITVIRGNFYISAADTGNLFIAALLDGIIGMVALIHSMRYISATRAQTLKSLYPLLACLLAFLIFKEPITALMAAGMVIATAGVILFENGKNVIAQELQGQ
ncbi:MAG: DMT family transporter [Candidatus Thermoplasmatota archaeon]|nr:DMT family transporter [Candidatus Thermoplasmatota archaeon]